MAWPHSNQHGFKSQGYASIGDLVTETSLGAPFEMEFGPWQASSPTNGDTRRPSLALSATPDSCFSGMSCYNNSQPATPANTVYSPDHEYFLNHQYTHAGFDKYDAGRTSFADDGPASNPSSSPVQLMYNTNLHAEFGTTDRFEDDCYRRNSTFAGSQGAAFHFPPEGILQTELPIMESLIPPGAFQLPESHFVTPVSWQGTTFTFSPPQSADRLEIQQIERRQNLHSEKTASMSGPKSPLRRVTTGRTPKSRARERVTRRKDSLRQDSAVLLSNISQDHGIPLLGEQYAHSATIECDFVGEDGKKCEHKSNKREKLKRHLLMHLKKSQRPYWCPKAGCEMETGRMARLDNTCQHFITHLERKKTQGKNDPMEWPDLRALISEMELPMEQKTRLIRNTEKQIIDKLFNSGNKPTLQNKKNLEHQRKWFPDGVLHLHDLPVLERPTKNTRDGSKSKRPGARL